MGRDVQHSGVYRTRAERLLGSEEVGRRAVGRLPQFRQTVDDSKPYLITDLHLDHLGRQAGAHALGVFQIELDLSTATFDEMKQQHRRQTLEFFICRVLAHVQDLRHASRPFSKGHQHLSPYG